MLIFDLQKVYLSANLLSMKQKQHPKVPTLSGYINGLTDSERTKLESETGTTIAYLRQIAGGFRRASTDMALAIERATAGTVPKNLLRPDVWSQAA